MSEAGDVTSPYLVRLTQTPESLYYSGLTLHITLNGQPRKVWMHEFMGVWVWGNPLSGKKLLFEAKNNVVCSM